MAPTNLELLKSIGLQTITEYFKILIQALPLKSKVFIASTKMPGLLLVFSLETSQKFGLAFWNL